MDQHRLAQRPEARPFTVEDLLGLVKRGKIRLPDFQRPLRWRTPHVQRLFDSVYRGLPIGALLLSQRDAEPETIGFGAYRQKVDRVPEAYFVVDGQQRVAAFVAALLHPDPVPRGDVHAIWFDLENEDFQRLSRKEPAPAWIPLNVLGDSMKQMRWMLEWPHRRDREDLVERALAVGKAIREYQVPAYILRDASEDVLREVYRRINDSGVAMRESEVFTALFHHGEPRPLSNACRRLSELGFGETSEDLFLTCLKSVEGVDSRKAAQSSDGEALSGVATPESVARTEEALRTTITFLMEDVAIPHTQLLPYTLPLPLLSQFFTVHPDPHPRSRTLLARWVWRGALSGAHADNSHATFRKLRALIKGDEAESVQRLLETTPAEPDYPGGSTAWYGQAAKTKLCALAMLSLAPRDPRTGAAVEVAELQARLDRQEISRVFPPIPPIGRKEHAPVARRVYATREGLKALASAPPAILATHAIDPDAAEALRKGDLESLEQRRAVILDEAFRRFFSVRCGAGESDRPAMEALVQRAERLVHAA